MRLIFELQERGFTLRPEGDDALVVTPPQRLTADDCRRIRRWKHHVLALLAYETPEVEQ